MQRRIDARFTHEVGAADLVVSFVLRKGGVRMIQPRLTDYGWEAVVNGRLIEAATEQDLRDLVETEEEARRRKALNEQLAEDQRRWQEFVLR